MRLGSVVLLVSFGCGTGRPPASEPAATHEHRELRAAIERLEQKLAAVAARLDERATQATEGASKGAALSLEDRLERLTQRVQEQETDLRQLQAGAPVGSATPPSPPRARPEVSAVYAVPVDGFPSRGPENAPVTMVRSYEFACPYSHKSRSTMEDLLRAYPRDLRIVYRSFIVHPQHATAPARAVCAAAKQGRFVEMHDLVWTRGYEANRDLGVENMERIAGELKLDIVRFRRDVDGACVGEVRDDQAELERLGQAGTPAFWINGRFLSGARAIEDFKALIDAELAAANKQIGRRGVTRANYYRRVVLKGGKKSVSP